MYGGLTAFATLPTLASARTGDPQEFEIAALLIDTGWNDQDATAIVAAWTRERKPAITRALATQLSLRPDRRN